MASIQQLRSRIRDLERQLRDLRLQLREAEIAASPYKVGQIYTREVQSYWKPIRTERGEVVRFRQAYGLCPVLRLFKKDGTLGQREIEMGSYGNWKLETDAPQA